jgi:hypothetical protein
MLRLMGVFLRQNKLAGATQGKQTFVRDTFAGASSLQRRFEKLKLGIDEVTSSFHDPKVRNYRIGETRSGTHELFLALSWASLPSWRVLVPILRNKWSP